MMHRDISYSLRAKTGQVRSIRCWNSLSVKRGSHFMKSKIIIVDDEKDTCDIVSKILGDEGYKTFSTISSRSALAKIKKEKPDLVLMDIKMPGMDGIEMLKCIREIDKSITVVMMTAYGDVDTAREAMRLGAFDYITKPFDIDVLKSVAREALKRK